MDVVFALYESSFVSVYFDVLLYDFVDMVSFLFAEEMVFFNNTVGFAAHWPIQRVVAVVDRARRGVYHWQLFMLSTGATACSVGEAASSPWCSVNSWPVLCHEV